MISAVTNAHQPEPVAGNVAPTKATAPATTNKKTTQQSSASKPADSVQISSAAQAALKETLETSAQTAREAAGGDRQAQRLIARESAAEKGQ